MHSDSKHKTYVIQMFFNPTPFGWENHFCQQSWCFKSGGVICAAKTGPVVCMPGCVFFFCGKDLGKWHLIHILRLVSQLAQWSLHTRSWTVLVNDPFWRIGFVLFLHVPLLKLESVPCFKTHFHFAPGFQGVGPMWKCKSLRKVDVVFACLSLQDFHSKWNVNG